MPKVIRNFKLILLSAVLLFSIVPANALAYSSPYYATRLENSGQMGGQATQIIARGNIIYASFYGTCNIYKIVNGITIQNVAGIRGSCGDAPDGSVANQNLIGAPSSIDVGSDGTVYFTEPYSHLVRAVLPNGELTTIAGNGTLISGPLRTDAQDATQTSFNYPAYVKIDPNGVIYIYDQGVIRRILADGSTDRAAGNFTAFANTNPYVDGGIATDHALMTLESFSSTINGASWCYFDFDPQGNLIVSSGNQIYKVVLATGRIYKIYETPNAPSSSLEDQPLANVGAVNSGGFDIDSNGKMWFTTGVPTGSAAAIRYASPEDQIVRTVAGGGNNWNVLTANNSAIPGSGLRLPFVTSISLDGDRIYYTSAYMDSSGYQDIYIGKLSILQDSTPPSIQDHLSLSPNAAGWINADATLTWDVADPETPVTAKTGCDTTSINSDAVTTYTCTASSVGGTSSKSSTVRKDSVSPQISILSMSGSINSFLLGDILISNATNIDASISDNLSGTTYAEYFLDSVQDPGQGNAHPMTISGSSATATVSLKGLTPGQHQLFYRSRDTAGNWSTTGSAAFTYIGL